MKEADVYVRSITNFESEDFKIFSPRTLENTHQDEINKTNREKYNCEERNKQLYDKRDILLKQINSLKEILEHRDNDHNLTVLTIQEQDRQRIARDLHDISLQNLAHLIHKIELAGLYVDQDPIKAKLELSVINKMLKENIDEIRNIIFDLRPMTFDDLGIGAAFERLLETVNEGKKYFIESEISNVSCENNLILVSIYRIVQECITNIDKHANADKIYFSCVQRDDKCFIVVRDNGKGFDVNEGVEEKHFGLSLIKERVYLLNGKIQINSDLGQGTEVQIEIPLLF